MHTDYEFSNVLGGAYSDGNLQFTADGLSLVSPMGNRVSLYDLPQNRNAALAFEAPHNVVLVDISKEEDLLVLADDDAMMLFVHFPSSTNLGGCNLAHVQSASAPRALKLSPDARRVAVAINDRIEVWTTPWPRVVQFRSLVRLSNLMISSAPASCFQWFSDNWTFAAGFEDGVTRIAAATNPFMPAAARRKNPQHLPPLGSPTIAVFFLNAEETELLSLTIGSVAARSRLDTTTKTPTDEDGAADATDSRPKRWLQEKRQNLPDAKGNRGLRCADFSLSSGILALGYDVGKIILHRVTSTLTEIQFTPLQEMELSAQAINSIVINPRGDWIAVASKKLGQVVVWDWRAEVYVMRQQSHQAADITCVAYSHDGAVMATGGEDGKVKAWKGAHSHCFVTFTEHTANVMAVKFNATNSLFSASMDGTVRAFDMNRYRHYRVFTTPNPVQFCCLALDVSGEVVAAGCCDAFDIYVWSAKTGRILEVLSGHESPVSHVQFSPVANVLISGSWDKTLKIWPMFIGEERTKERVESLPLVSEVLCVVVNNAGTELAALTLAGMIEFFDSSNVTDIHPSRGGIDVSRDILGGYMLEEVTKQYSSTAGRYVETAAYTGNDAGLLVAGSTKWLCLYDVTNRLLLRRWQMSANLSVDGIREYYDHRSQTEAGNRRLLPSVHHTAPGFMSVPFYETELPGVERGKPGAVEARASRPVARTRCVAFAPNGREWAAATTTGLLIYSLDGAAAGFRPHRLEYGLTPQRVYQTLREGNYGQALHQALQLNEESVLKAVVCGVPSTHIEFIAGQVPPAYVSRLLELIAAELQSGPHFQFCLEWSLQLQLRHAALIQREALHPQLRELAKAIAGKASELKALSDTNVYGLRYLQAVATIHQRHPDQNPWLDDGDKYNVDALVTVETSFEVPEEPIEEPTEEPMKTKRKAKKHGAPSAPAEVSEVTEVVPEPKRPKKLKRRKAA